MERYKQRERGADKTSAMILEVVICIFSARMLFVCQKEQRIAIFSLYLILIKKQTTTKHAYIARNSPVDIDLAYSHPSCHGKQEALLYVLAHSAVVVERVNEESTNFLASLFLFLPNWIKITKQTLDENLEVLQ